MAELNDQDIRTLRNALFGVKFLFHMKVHEMDLLVSAMKKRSYKAGDVVIRQGDTGDVFYIVGSGKLSVWVKKGLKDKQIDQRFPEQFFGEMALVSREPRMATIKAEEPSELYLLDKATFDSILMHNPAIAKTIREEIVRRKAKSL